MIDLNSFPSSINVAIIGASGGIGGAIANELSKQPSVNTIYALSRHRPSDISSKTNYIAMDICAEEQIETAAKKIDNPLHIVIVASGILHDEHLSPEKTIKALNADAMQHIFNVNTIGPALVAKHFLPLLARDEKSVFAALSARVGSISDNAVGGWYSYRASKSALNMIIKSASIEMARKYKKAAIIGLHPGTVDTKLSEPFQSNVKEGKLFSSTQSARYLLNVVNTISAAETGKTFAWDGTEIAP